MSKWFGVTITERHERLLGIMEDSLIITSSTLADKVGVTQRTIYRDIQALRRDGHKILGAGGAGYLLLHKKDLLWPAGENENGD